MKETVEEVTTATVTEHEVVAGSPEHSSDEVPAGTDDHQAEY